MKAREKLLNEVTAKVEKHRIMNMQKLTKFEYDDVSRPSDRSNKEKISRIHRLLLWLESLVSIRNFVILGIMLVIFAV